MTEVGSQRTPTATLASAHVAALRRTIRIATVMVPLTLVLIDLITAWFGAGGYQGGDLYRMLVPLWPAIVFGLIVPMVLLAAWVELGIRVVAADGGDRPHRALLPLRLTFLFAGVWAIVGVAALFRFLTGVAHLVPVGQPVAATEASTRAMVDALVLCQGAVAAGLMALAAWFLSQEVQALAHTRGRTRENPLHERFPGLIGALIAFAHGRTLSFWAGFLLVAIGLVDGILQAFVLALHFTGPGLQSDLAVIGGQLTLLTGLFVFGIVLLQSNRRDPRPGWDARTMLALIAATTLFAGLITHPLAPLRGTLVTAAAMMQFLDHARRRPEPLEDDDEPRPTQALGA